MVPNGLKLIANGVEHIVATVNDLFKNFMDGIGMRNGKNALGFSRDKTGLHTL